MPQLRSSSPPLRMRTPAFRSPSTKATTVATARSTAMTKAKRRRGLQERFPKQRLVSTCERLFASGEPGLQAFLDKLADNVPTGLFVLLPLMAAILKLLYPLSRRYYAEHLLFVLHFHSFVFLALIISEFLERLTPMPIPTPVSVILGIVLTSYVPIYLFKALRRVYGQGRVATLLKFVPLVAAYGVGIAIILLIAAMFAAFSP